jgi:hypothetical protein
MLELLELSKEVVLDSPLDDWVSEVVGVEVVSILVGSCVDEKGTLGKTISHEARIKVINARYVVFSDFILPTFVFNSISL